MYFKGVLFFLFKPKFEPFIDSVSFSIITYTSSFVQNYHHRVLTKWIKRRTYLRIFITPLLSLTSALHKNVFMLRFENGTVDGVFFNLLRYFCYICYYLALEKGTRFISCYLRYMDIVNCLVETCPAILERMLKFRAKK